MSTDTTDRLTALLRKVNDETVRVTWIDEQSGDSEYEISARQLDASRPRAALGCAAHLLEQSLHAREL